MTALKIMSTILANELKNKEKESIVKYSENVYDKVLIAYDYILTFDVNTLLDEGITPEKLADILNPYFVSLGYSINEIVFTDDQIEVTLNLPHAVALLTDDTVNLVIESFYNSRMIQKLGFDFEIFLAGVDNEVIEEGTFENLTDFQKKIFNSSFAN